MTITKRFMAFFTALAIVLTSSSVWSTTAYAVVYPPQTKKPAVTSNTTVGDVWTYNYTQGMDIYANFINNGIVNVSGGSFNIINGAHTVENNGTFTFTSTDIRSTFSLGNSGTFVNNGTATITNVYNFTSPSGSSFTNNGTLYLENIANINLTGFTNYGVIIFPDDAKNGDDYVYRQFESKCKDGGQVYTQTEWENRKLNYLINYEGLNADNYYDYENPNPAYYEWSAADPQNVTLTEPALPGYEFLGWTGLSVTEPAKDFTFPSSVCQNVTVTAHWKPIIYTIAYDLDGGSFSTGNTPNTEYSRGDQPALIIPYKTGYTFAGWIDTDTNEQVSVGDSIYYLPSSVIGNKSFKASFIADTDTQYKVICCYQNIDGTYDEKEYLLAGETDAQVSVSSGDYVKEGFTFDSDNSGNVLSGTIKADNSLELKLYFDRNKYTVTFKSQDGGETLWTTEKYLNETVGEYGGVIPTKTSDDDLYTYVFDNWARGEPDRDFGYNVSNVVVSENITFYAAFKKVRDESIVVITWEEYDGFNAPAQTKIRLDKGADYAVELQLLNENYYIGTPEWSLGFQEAHIYWYDPQSGEQGIEYTVSKENFESPVTLTISNVQHDTFIKIKAHYHNEHDYSAAYDEIIQNGNCTTDSVIRHFCYKCGKTYDETVSADGHVTGSTFEKDNISHWKTCNICGEEIGLETHTPDNGVITYEPTHNSTGTKIYTCTVCGYITDREVLPMIPHSPVGDWQSNAKSHYKLCSCKAILEEAPHTPDDGTVTLEPTYDTEGKMEYHCTVCGYSIGETAIAPLGHNVDDEWQSEVSGHWHNCDCGKRHNFGGHISDGGLLTSKPTYEEYGERIFSCKVCGYVLSIETIPPLNHKTDGEWVFDEKNHWKEGCGCGEKHELTAHTPDEGVITAEPTHNSTGIKTYTCTVCGYVTGREVLPMIPHVPVGDWQSNAKAHYKLCSCGAILEETPHTPDDGTVTLEPTYDAEGKMEYHCIVCGYVLSIKTIPPLNHKTDGEWVFDEKNHWKEGCGCGEKHELAVHTPDNGVITAEPTHNSTGIKTYTCTVCGYVTNTEVLPMIPHVPVGDWQSNAKSHYKLCSCGAILEETPHTPDDGTVTLEPTYDTEGKMEYHCIVCGYSIGETAIAPLGHNVDDEWQSEVSGHWHNCDCGERHNFGGHISDSGTVTLYPTETEEGEREYRCTVCRYVIKTEVIPALGGGSETPSHPDNGIPFIKNENTKNGWNVIKAEAEIAAEGGVITVDMNGTTIVPGYVIDTITGRDVTLVFDMGGDISWSVNGKSVTVENVGDTDFLVKKNTNAIPIGVVNKLTGERLQISLAHNGEFGFTAALSIYLGSENADLYAALYFYNDGDLTFIDESKIAQDGMATLTFTHASDYLIVIDKKSNSYIEKPDDGNGTNELVPPDTNDKITTPVKSDEDDTENKNPETGEAKQPWKIMLIGYIAAFVSAFSLKRKKSPAK